MKTIMASPCKASSEFCAKHSVLTFISLALPHFPDLFSLLEEPWILLACHTGIQGITDNHMEVSGESFCPFKPAIL